MNINRDYLIINDVKKSNVKLDNGSIVFYITDKNTQNIFVNLVINVSNNDLIQKYANIENAEDYTLTMNIVKPDNTYKIIEGKLHDKEKAIFEFDLKEDCVDKIGTYKCELLTKCNINDHEEITTSNKLTYKVKSSVLNDLDEIQEAPEYPLVIQLFDKLSDIEQYEEDRRANELARQLAEEQRQTRFDTLDSDMVDRITAMDDKMVDVENRVSAKEQAVDKLIVDTKKDIDDYKVAKDQEIDEYKSAKDTEINNAITNQDNKIDTAISEQNDRISNAIATQDNKIDTAIKSQNDRIAVVENNDVVQDNRLDVLENKDVLHESRLDAIEVKNQQQDNRLDIVENKNTQQDNRLDVVEAKNVEQDNRLDAIEAIDVAQNSRLDAIEVKNQEQDDRLLDIEKVNKRQDMNLKCLFAESKNNMIDIAEEGNSIYLQNSTIGYTLIDEIQGNTMVNCNKEPDKEIILNGNINTEGYSNITLNKGVDGGLVDIALEGNTMVNVCDQKDPVAITKSYTVETGNHVALQGDYDGKCRPVVTGKTLVNLRRASNSNLNISDTSLCEVTSTSNKVSGTIHSAPDWMYLNMGSLKGNTLFKPDTKYTIVFKEAVKVTDVSLMRGDGSRMYSNQAHIINNKAVITTKSNINDYVLDAMDCIYVFFDNSSYYPINFSCEIVSVLEGDYTDKPIPDYFEGLQSSFEDKVVTQEMVDNGEEVAENLGKYKVDYAISREDGTIGQTKTFYLNSPLLEGDTIEQQGDNVVHVHRSEIRAYQTDDELTLPTDMTNTLVAKAIPQYEVISQNDTILCDSYVNGHLDVDSVVPIEKVAFKNWGISCKYLYPSTEYVIQFESDNIGKLNNTGLGGKYTSNINVVKGLNKINLTTNDSPSHTTLSLIGIGFNASNIVVTEATDQDFGYFEGMKSVGECEDLEVVSSNSDGTLSNTQTLTHEPLRAVGDIKDKYVLIDGKWYIERNCREVVLDGSKDEYWLMNKSLNNGSQFIWGIGGLGVPNTNSNVMCDSRKSIIGDDMDDNNKIWIYNGTTFVVHDSSISLDDFKHKLQQNPLTVIYQLATPQYEPIEYNPFTVYSDTTHISNNSTIPCNMTIKNHGYNCLLKPSTTYTVSSNLGLNTVTTGADIGDSCLRFYNEDTSDKITMKDVLILEGDWTSKADLIPGNFNGIESCFEQELVTDENDVNYGKYKVTAKVIGKNLMNQDLGIYNPSLNSNTICFPVCPNTTYTYSSSNYKGYVAIYELTKAYPNDTSSKEIDKHDIKNHSIQSGGNFTTSPTTKYIFMNYDPESDVQIEQGNVATVYEPYKENNITFYIDEPLRGTGTAKDKVFIQDNKVVVERNCGSEVFDGSDDEDVYPIYGSIYNNKCLYGAKIPKLGLKGKNLKSNTLNTSNGATEYYDEGIYLFDDNVRFIINARTLNNIYTASSFKQWLQQNPTTVVYQLSEPTYEEVEYDDVKLFIESFKNSTLFYNSNIPVTSKLWYSYSVPLVDTVAQTANISDEQDNMIIDLATQVAVMEMMLM